MVVKKTSRTPKSPVPVPETPAAGTAAASRSRKPRASAKRAAPAVGAAPAAARPKAPRVRRVTTPVASVDVPVVAPALVVTDDEVRVRAYFLSIEHRGQGSPEYFWQLAERELRGRGTK